MRLKFLILLTLLFIGMIICLSCGSNINKSALNAEEYFAYAKGLYDDGDYYEAIQEFTVIVLKFSGTPLVDDAQFYLAESHFMNEEYLIAAAEYQKVVEDYPESPYVEEAFYKIGLSYSELSQRPALDQEYTHKALRQFQNFIEAYPEGEFRDKAEKQIFKLRSKLAKKQLLGGNVYRKMGIYDSAIIYYNILLDKYYDTPAAEPAMFWKAECQYKLKKYSAAIATFNGFIEKYPNSEYRDEAQTRVGEIQEKTGKQEVEVSETQGNQ